MAVPVVRRKERKPGHSFHHAVEPPDNLVLVRRSLRVAGIHGALLLASSPCIALNRSYGWRQKGIEALFNDSVALAGCFFEAGAIENYNLPPMIADKASRL